MFLVFPSHGDLGRRVVGNGEDRAVFAVPDVGKEEVVGHVGVQVVGVGFGRNGDIRFGIGGETIEAVKTEARVLVPMAKGNPEAAEVSSEALWLNVVDGGVVGA